MNNRLLTPQLERLMEPYPLYSQDGKGKDAICIEVFKLANARWYILEASKEDDDIIMFGVVIGLVEDEYGYISLNELADISVKHPIFGALNIIPKQGFQPCKLGEIKDPQLQEFLNRLHKEEED